MMQALFELSWLFALMLGLGGLLLCWHCAGRLASRNEVGAMLWMFGGVVWLFAVMLAFIALAMERSLA